MDLKKEFRHNNLRTAYGYVRKIREGYKSGTDLCKDKKGQILRERLEIKARWASYFEELLNQGRRT